MASSLNCSQRPRGIFSWVCNPGNALIPIIPASPPTAICDPFCFVVAVSTWLTLTCECTRVVLLAQNLAHSISFFMLLSNFPFPINPPTTTTSLGSLWRPPAGPLISQWIGKKATEPIWPLRQPITAQVLLQSITPTGYCGAESWMGKIQTFSLFFSIAECSGDV